MGIPILGTLVELGKDVLDRVLPDKMSEAEKAEVKSQWAVQMQSKESDWQDFVLKHVGEAKDMPRSIQIVRGLIRPVVTLAAVVGFFAFSAWLFNNLSLITDEAQLSVIHEVQVTSKAMLYIVLGFWFGDKFLTRTGIVDALFRRKAMKRGEEA